MDGLGGPGGRCGVVQKGDSVGRRVVGLVGVVVMCVRMDGRVVHRSRLVPYIVRSQDI